MLPLWLSTWSFQARTATAERNSEAGGDEASPRGAQAIRSSSSWAISTETENRSGRDRDDAAVGCSAGRRRGASRGRHERVGSRGVGRRTRRSRLGPTTSRRKLDLLSAQRAGASASTTRGAEFVDMSAASGSHPRVRALRRMDRSPTRTGRHDLCSSRTRGRALFPRPRGRILRALRAAARGRGGRSAIGSWLGMVRRGERGCGHKQDRNSPARDVTVVPRSHRISWTETTRARDERREQAGRPRSSTGSHPRFAFSEMTRPATASGCIRPRRRRSSGRLLSALHEAIGDASGNVGIARPADDQARGVAGTGA